MTNTSSQKYLALLRGVNVGGNAKLSMSELKAALSQAGFGDLSTYINSGNVIFTAQESNTDNLAKQISKIIRTKLGMDVDVVVLSKAEWTRAVKQAPAWWGNDSTRKHNLLVLLKPYDIKQVMQAIGELKPDIESAEPGEGVVYQSLSLKDFGKTTTGKLASKPIYKRMTVRNYNTATRLLKLLEDE